MEEEALAFGRYVVRGHLGAGGMGQVLRAYDPKLDREVAIKIVKEPSSTAAARLLREAKTMAAVIHPNVVAVYDVATKGDDVFVAMELVHGQTLREWLEPGRPWQEVVRVFVRAAEGLHAAHRQGLVHRDFKPDNVMVDLGADDRVMRVRVMDFGLAVSTEDMTSVQTPGEVVFQSDRLTQTGALVGTPLYLAPELEAGAPATEASDQYAFCVALFEGLYGTRPFDADSADALSRKKWAAEIEVPARSAVPEALHAVVVRGLSAMPPERWPTMPSLVEAMEAAAVETPQRRWVAPAVMASVGGIAAAGWFVPADESACDEPAALVGEVWGDTHRNEAREAFAATELEFAGTSADRAVELLDTFAERWVDAWPSGCEAEQALVQQTCLRGRLGELAAVAESFQIADPKTVRLSLETAAGLSDPRDCAFEADDLQRTSEQRDAARKADDLLRRARVAESTGAYEQATDLVEQAGRAAVEADDCALISETLYERAQQTAGKGDLAGGLELAESAYFEALRCDAALPAAQAARYAMSMHNWGTGDFEAAEVWFGHAEAQLELVGPGPKGQPEIDRAVLLYTHAQLQESVGDRDGTLASLDEAGALLEPWAEEFPRVMTEFLAPRGAATMTSEGRKASLVHYNRGLAIAESNFGEHHPMVAIGYGNLGNNYQHIGRLEEAEAALRRTAELMPLAFGETHPYVARSSNAIAQTLTLRGRWDEASTFIAKGLEVAAVSEPDGGPETWRLLGTRAAISSHFDDLESARADMQRIVDASESDGQIGSSAVYNIMKLAEYQIGLGRLDEAEYRLEQAADHQRKHLAGEAVLAAKIEGTFALLHEAREDYPAAIASYTRAKKGIAESLGQDTLEWAEIHEAHADLLMTLERTDEARPMLETLEDVYGKVEMPEDVERIRLRLSQL